jgi:outer membrane receptor protein involved in Fe transport
MAYSVVRGRGLLTASLAALALAQLASPASAQATDPAQTDDSVAAQAPQEEDPQEEVVVTGSRIARPELSLPNPVQVLSAETIEQSGKTNLTDFLVNSPALIGSQTNTVAAGSNLTGGAQNVGVNLLNLRNLGTSRTLVLVDGRRHVAGYPGIAAVDTNTIPTDLVEKVDILTGGASAIYGADGVSGVVNFILKKDFDGLRVRGQTSISERGDAGEYFIAATAGKNFADGRGNVTVSYEYNKQDRFSQRDRLNYGQTGPSWAFVRNLDDPDGPTDNDGVPDRILYTNLRWADSSPGGAIDLDGDFTPDRTGEGGIYDLGTYLPGSAFTIGGSSTPRETYYGDFTPFSERHIANVMARYEFSPAFEIYAEGKYVRSKAFTFAQPTYDFLTELAPDNAYLSADMLAVNQAATAAGDCDDPDTGDFETCAITFNRDHFDFGIRRYEMERELFRTVVGAKGEIASNLNYDVSYVFGQSTQEATNRNDRITERYYAALDAVSDGAGGITCRINLPGQTTVQGNNYGGQPVFNGAPTTFTPGQCVPLNILGQGSPSQAALDFVTVDHTSWARIQQHVVSAVLSGNTGSFFNLPGGPVGFAVGAEYRKEKSRFVPSDYSLAGALMDDAPARVDEGSFDVKEAYAEVNLPILADMPFAENLSIGGAIRLSDYSTIGTTTTWNVNGSYSPVRDITFRGTYSEAVRAPNINELFAGGSGTYEFITDPCGIDRIGEGTQYREANCAAALSALGIDPATFNPADDFTSPQNSSLLGFQGGNPMLNEETAKTWTAGVVLRPSFVPGLSLTADWYDIRLKQAIQYSTAQDIVDLCVDQPDLDNIYCSVVERSPTTGYVSYYTIIPENVASFETAGLEVTLNYRFEPFDNAGVFNINLQGNYLNKLQFVPTTGADPENELASWLYPAPKYSAMFDLSWSKGPTTINYGINWWSRTRRVTREQEAANPDYVAPEYIWYKEKWEHELYFSHDVDDRFTFYAGINNLFDTKPDVGATAYPISAVGRSFFLGAKANIF